jgi:hypothetical protein
MSVNKVVDSNPVNRMMAVAGWAILALLILLVVGCSTNVDPADVI